MGLKENYKFALAKANSGEGISDFVREGIWKAKAISKHDLMQKPVLSDISFISSMQIAYRYASYKADVAMTSALYVPMEVTVGLVGKAGVFAYHLATGPKN